MPTLKGFLKGLGIVVLVLIVLEGGVWIIALGVFFWALFGGYDRYQERYGRRHDADSGYSAYDQTSVLDTAVPFVVGYELARHHDRSKQAEPAHHSTADSHGEDCDGDGDRW